MNLSTKLAQLRRQQGWSQDDLAIQLDVSRQAVYKWETGASRPDTDKLLVLARLFNVSVDNLLDDESEIVFRAEPTKKIPYGQVIVNELPSGTHGSEIYYASTEEESKVLKKFESIFKIWIKVIKGLLIAFGASILLFFLFKENTAIGNIISILLFVIGFVFAPVAIIYPIAKKVFTNILEKKFTSDMEHTIFLAKKAEYEAQMTERGYKFIQLLPYLLEWFYIDYENGVFGFFFDGKDQLVCPIQNYIDLSGAEYDYVLKCYGDRGELIKQDIKLSNMAQYLVAAQNASALKRTGRLYDDKLLPPSTTDAKNLLKKSFEDTKDLIAFEQSKLA